MVLGGPGVLNWSSGSSSEASRALRFRRVEMGAVVWAAAVARRRRPREACVGVSADSSSIASTEVPRSDLICPAWESLSPATVSVWESMDLLLLRSRTEPPARDDARLPGLPRLLGPFRRERPDRGSGSGKDSSS